MEDHRHCLYCVKAIPSDRTFCSEECEKTFTKRHGRSVLIQRFVLIFLILFIIFMFLKKWNLF
ncbi:MAG: DUF2116 family Zn-ribbon domain-containing protein [Candidatus Hydrothermarchaeales archaeon]